MLTKRQRAAYAFIDEISQPTSPELLQRAMVSHTPYASAIVSKTHPTKGFSSRVCPQFGMEGHTCRRLVRSASYEFEAHAYVCNSRRGSQGERVGENELQFLFVHPSRGILPLPSTARTTEERAQAKKMIEDTLIRNYRDLGFIARDLRYPETGWEGIVRIPIRNEDGAWEYRLQRTEGIANRSGVFRLCQFR